MNDIPEFPGPDQFRTSSAEPSPAQSESRTTIEFDDSEANVMYANMLRIHSSPEDVAIDFAHTPNPQLLQDQKLKISQRIILNPHNAKRLLGMLAQVVKRHEDQFGPLELDVRKRMV
jgi:hypothetical protein